MRAQATSPLVFVFGVLAVFDALPGALAQVQYSPYRIFTQHDPFRLRGNSSSYPVNIANAGDVNADGVDDIIVGIPYWSRENAYGFIGAVWVISPIDGEVLHSLTGDASECQWGAAVGSAGDIDGDGHADFIVGAPGWVPGVGYNGRWLVYSGRTGVILIGNIGDGPSAGVGYSVASAGDVNNDGVPDIVVGTQHSGSAYVFSGTNGSFLHKWSRYPTALGRAVCGAGDVDTDGFDDVIVGAPLDSPGGLSSAGSVTFYSGQTGAVIRTIAGSESNQQMGHGVVRLGDVDGDGVDDFAISNLKVGGPHGRAAEIWGIDGATGSRLFTVTEYPLATDIKPFGDADDDGVQEFLVRVNSGRVAILRGQDGSVLYELSTALIPGNSFRSNPAAIGDLDADGVPEIAMATSKSGSDLDGRITIFCSGGLHIPLCLGDATYDQSVDIEDVTSIIANWQSASFDPYALGDADHNGSVNFDDINAVIANWLSTCP